MKLQEKEAKKPKEVEKEEKLEEIVHEENDWGKHSNLCLVLIRDHCNI